MNGILALLIYALSFFLSFSSAEAKTDARKNETHDLLCPQVELFLDRNIVDANLGPGFSKIVADGRVVPSYDEERKFIGFRAVQVRERSLYRRLNLMNEDIITSVNGQNLDRPDLGFQLYIALQKESKVRYEFLRDGKLCEGRLTILGRG